MNFTFRDVQLKISGSLSYSSVVEEVVLRFARDFSVPSVKSTYCESTKRIDAVQLAAILVSFADWGAQIVLIFAAIEVEYLNESKNVLMLSRLPFDVTSCNLKAI